MPTEIEIDDTINRNRDNDDVKFSNTTVSNQIDETITDVNQNRSVESLKYDDVLQRSNDGINVVTVRE
jgi:hypothetical protein